MPQLLQQLAASLVMVLGQRLCAVQGSAQHWQQRAEDLQRRLDHDQAALQASTTEQAASLQARLDAAAGELQTAQWLAAWPLRARSVLRVAGLALANVIGLTGCGLR